MKSLYGLKMETEDWAVEYEIIPPADVNSISNPERREIAEALQSIDSEIELCEKKVSELNSKIDQLTNHADGLDYMLAVASGILTGVIDALFIEDFSLEKADTIGNEKVNSYVVEMAKKKAEQKGKKTGKYVKIDSLYDAVKFLEDEYPIVADKATNAFGGGLQHHLRDFSHHPTPVGLFFSMLTQFTHKVYGTNVAGFFQVVEISEKNFVLIGKNLPEKIMFGVVNWFFHMVSDIAGSSGKVLDGKVGTGLPGPMVSMLKEISVLPIFRNTNEKGYKEFSVWISKLFNGTLLGDRDENGKLIPLKFDLRTEIGVGEQLKQQAIPVVINECIVRGFYFIRRFWSEVKNNNIHSFNELKNINWKKILPVNNRTVARMITIATGTFTAVDMTGAAIHSAVKSGGNAGAFFSNFILRVNFVGVGRFAIAVTTDVAMGLKRNKLVNERMKVIGKEISLLNVKAYYKCAELYYAEEDLFESQKTMWIAAGDTVETLCEAYEVANESIIFCRQAISDIYNQMESISGYLVNVEEKNPGVSYDMINILRWGKK